MINKLVLFHVDEQQFALPLDMVEQIVSIVEVCPLPKAPGHVAGTINYRGELLPVIDMRKLFLLPLREIELTDQLIIAKTAKMKMAIWVDSANEIAPLNNDQIITPDSVYLEEGLVKGLFKLNDGRVLISDPDKFLTPEQIGKLAILLRERNVF